MLLKVLSKSNNGYKNFSDVVCIDESGNKHIVDFLVDGGLPEHINRDDLVGKTIQVDYLLPYISIAMNPTILNNDETIPT